jgi:hypothetical protein
MDARDDHLQCIEDDPNLSQLPSDWEMTVADVSDSASVIRMYSREAKAAYLWNEEQGEIINPFYVFFSLTCNCKFRTTIKVERALLVAHRGVSFSPQYPSAQRRTGIFFSSYCR